MSQLGQVAYVLALVGGILLVIFGLLDLLGFGIGFNFPAISWGFAYAGIVGIICGIIAIIGSRSAATIVWGIVLIIVGIFGGGLGGLLVVLGGLIGLIAALTGR